MATGESSVFLKMDFENVKLTCCVCGAYFTHIKKLKAHLILKHPKKNFCLFCIEKKGWSDEFVSQSAYHDHYQRSHRGLIEQRRAERLEQRRTAGELARTDKIRQKEEAKRLNSEERRKTGSSGKKHSNSCEVCDGCPVFASGYERDRHLVEEHGHDICIICKLIGPGLSVSAHIAIAHSKDLCYVCCSLSPHFSNRELVGQHMVKSHGHNSSEDIRCRSCNESFPFVREYVAHVREVHGARGSHLRRLKRKRIPRDSQTAMRADEQKITGLRNDSYKDCHVLTALHLLAHTSLPDIVCDDSAGFSTNSTPGGSSTATGRNLIADFFRRYRASSVPFYPHQITGQPRSFDCASGAFPYSVGSVLRTLIQSAGGVGRVPPEFVSCLEWRFLCSSCNKFSRVTLQDSVIKVTACSEDSFEQHLNQFLCERVCTCGNTVLVEPDRVTMGDYLLVDLDRNISNKQLEEGSVEMCLYPLKLQNSYTILNSTFTVFATVNIKLDSLEGGHYNLNFIGENSNILRVHEASVESQIIYPAFDHSTIIVALKRKSDEDAFVNEDFLLADFNSSKMEGDTGYGHQQLVGLNGCGERLENSRQLVGLNNCEGQLLSDPICGGQMVSDQFPTTGVIFSAELSSGNLCCTDNQVLLGRHTIALSAGEPISTMDQNPPDGPDLSSCSLLTGTQHDVTSHNKVTSSGQALFPSGGRMRTYNRFGHRFKKTQNKMLTGDNLVLFLNSDPSIVEMYRKKHKEESGPEPELHTPVTFSLKVYGAKILESKSYRHISLTHRNTGACSDIDYTPTVCAPTCDNPNSNSEVVSDCDDDEQVTSCCTPTSATTLRPVFPDMWSSDSNCNL